MLTEPTGRIAHALPSAAGVTIKALRFPGPLEMSRPASCLRLLRLGAVMGAALVLPAAVPAQTPYKVVAPDGRVTYTDRPSTGAENRVSLLRAPVEAPAEVALPFELRQVVGRYPVTLYVTTDDCTPCVAARELLRRRGIPFGERQVQTADDALALERLSGSREAPTLGIGAQILRGLNDAAWNSTLDDAGYPRESRLPANYRYPAPTPLAPRAPAPAPEGRATPVADPPVTLPVLPGASGNDIRF